MRLLVVSAATAFRRCPRPNLDHIGAYALALLWVAPLLYAVWTAFRDPAAVFNLDMSAGWTLDNVQKPGAAPHGLSIYEIPLF